jgi:hypothetical protein
MSDPKWFTHSERERTTVKERLIRIGQAGGPKRGRKIFFSEEKKQKTFIFSACTPYPAMAWISTLALN